jgi:hypothetical protein
MIDPLDLETLMEIIPRRRFVGVNDRTFCNARRMNEAAWLSVLKPAGTELPPRSRITTTTVRLGFGSATGAGCGDILLDWRVHAATKVAAINFSLLTFTADNATLHFPCHGFTQLVQEDERGLVARAD